ncbi:hypothetical protein T4E_1275 [Trichinella pseudospiralis]|uniref:Uncharacterized protein n=1 Tax=Trichinella pseudospiralis TaxID=6337 RepID=A0A0V1FSV1_TRIPS|nr:hypothetical protein T4E_1275 [Trichinella pseudospiralis]KRY89079.1 hypothetical protein T4D_6123 [Trichinella pseudospiralis]
MLISIELVKSINKPPVGESEMFYLYREQKKSLAVPLPEVLKLKHKTRLVEVYFGKWARDGKKRG